MLKMSNEDRERFLADLHVGVIAIERPDRAPLAVPIWYAYEPGGELSIFTSEGTLKDKLIRAAGRFSFTAQDEAPPYKYVTVEGDVTSVGPADETDYRALAVRYLGDEAGNQFTDQTYSPSSIVIRMRPKKWLSVDYSDE
ncbi:MULTISPECIES: pyridoxamine 5'-phosphate oxidase family protein [unclassified Mycobacterium]|uniref:pyridoxamine 5'-phosphate oxidase family protein n=1 Tax=unclassified Mycobacterium TaxID=2642494 RepID=UPI0029C62E3C|nr:MULTISPECIES: pyridoxamine 5'-phosphate oxidase family protein [unclassified Mycobacterium]